MASLLACRNGGQHRQAEAVEPPGAGFPRTLLDGGRSEVTIRARPVRIVSQTLGTDEILWAICQRERIVGVSKIGLEPKYSPIADELRSANVTPVFDAEEILRLQPDLVFVASYSLAETVESLKASGATVFRFANFDSIEAIQQNIRQIGQSIGEESNAEKLIERMNAELSAVKARIPAGIKPPRVLSYYPAGDTAGADTSFDAIVRATGAINVVAEKGLRGFPKISAEQVAEWQPDFIIRGATPAKAAEARKQLLDNPLASPDIIGTSAGGAFAAVIAMVTGLAMREMLALPAFSFAGSLLALFAVYGLTTRGGRTPVATLLLAGVAFSSLFAAASSFLISMTWVRWEVAQEITFWLMGGLDNRQWAHCLMVLPCAVIGLGAALSRWRELDLLLTGEETALALGVEIEKTKRLLLVNAALLTGASVAVSGVIGFVGLIAPHAARLLIGPSHRRLLPASALLGAIFLVAADLLARTVIRPEEIRLGIITAGCGAPFFLFLLLRRRREAV